MLKLVKLAILLFGLLLCNTEDTFDYEDPWMSMVDASSNVTPESEFYDDTGTSTTTSSDYSHYPFDSFITDATGKKLNTLCDSSLCSNQGVCYTNKSAGPSGFYCSCYKPYYGKYCDQSPKCVHDGTVCATGSLMVNELGETECICPYGKYGPNCEKQLTCNDSKIECNSKKYSKSCYVVVTTKCYCCNKDNECTITDPIIGDIPCFTPACFKIKTLANSILRDAILSIIYRISTAIVSTITTNSNQITDAAVILTFLGKITQSITDMDTSVDEATYLRRIQSLFSILDLLLSSQQNEILVSESLYSNAKKVTETIENYFKRLNYQNATFTYTYENVDLINVNDFYYGYYGFIKNLYNSNINILNDLSNIDYLSLQTSAFVNKATLNLTDENPQRFTFVLYKNSKFFITKEQLNGVDIETPIVMGNQRSSTTTTTTPSPIFDTDNKTNGTIKCGRQVISDIVSITSDKSYAGPGLITTNFKTYQPVNISDECKNFKMVPKCVFWNYGRNDWDTRGCRYYEAEYGVHKCVCDHMTHFAVLMEFENRTADSSCSVCNQILDITSYIGASISILGLLITILLYVGQLKCCKREMLKDNTQTMFNEYIRILITFCFSLLILNALYIVFSLVKWPDNLKLCMVFGVFLHYMLLVSFCWMISLGVVQNLIYIKVFTAVRKFYLCATLCSLIIPLIPIITLLSINWRMYLHSSNYCWVSEYAHIFTVIVPIAAAIFINSVFMVLLIREHCLCCKKKSEKNSKTNIIRSSASVETLKKKQTAIFSTCSVNMGLTWIFGILVVIPTDTYANTVFSYIFCIFNAFQGFLIFIAYNILIKSRREYSKTVITKVVSSIRSKLSTKSVDKAESNSSLNSNSTHASKNSNDSGISSK